MGVKDCLASAVDQGAIGRNEAAALADEFDERFAQRRADLGDDMAAAQARADLEKALRATAAEARRRANLTEAARQRLKSRLQSWRDPKGRADVYKAAEAVLSHYGFRGSASVRGRGEAIVAMAHGKLADVMWTFRRSGVLGRRRNQALVSDLVKELHGEASNSTEARQLATALSGVFEDLRRRFNNAGGAIPRLENWGLPHSHDRRAIKHAGRDAWKARIRDRLDPARMIDPLTGDPVGAGGLDRALDHVFDSIVSDGWANRTPAMVPAGRGAVATQRQDQRFLVFKTAQDWQAYHSEFGRGDVIQSIFQHINGMARDIAAMEVLGPNPAAMVEYLKQVVGHELGKLQAGQPSLARKRTLDESSVRFAQYRLDSLYQYLRGRPEVVSGWAKATSDLKNINTAALLGATGVLASVTDPFIAQAARRLAGLPVMKDFGRFLKLLRGQNRKDIIRAGVIWEEYLHLMNDEVRYAGIVTGSDWSRWIVDRSTMASGLKPVTTGRKMTEARAWHAHLADEAGKPFGELDARLRRTMEGFGINAADWDIMRAAVDPQGFVTPASIEAAGGRVRYLDLSEPLTDAEQAAELTALAHRSAAEKLAELTSSWSERAVPTGTPNARSLVTGTAERGTVPGELVDLGLQFKSFGLSFTSLQIEAVAQASLQAAGGRLKGGATYLALLAIPMTIGGAVYLQIKSIADGKDPEDMSPTNTDFWLRAMITGGGFGLFGDFLAASENRFGQSLPEALAGPGIAFGGDLLGLTLGNALELVRGDDTKAGRDLTRFLNRYTPVLSSHVATRAGYKRMMLDQLQWLVDPEAHKSFRAREGNQRRRTGQRFFWPPGAFEPERDPDFGAVLP